MQMETLTFLSADGTSQVFARLWMPEPETAVRGAIQLVHGMEEHGGRYEAFADFLAHLGYLVGIHDHVGHGHTAPDRERLGHIPFRGGSKILVEDTHAMHDILRTRLTSLDQAQEPVRGSEKPLILFGHSMGSFVVRSYLGLYATGVSAAIICGTGQQPGALLSFGKLMTALLARFHGEHTQLRLLDTLVTGGFSRAIKSARTPLDWLSVDPAVVDAYRADPCCGHRFSVGGYRTLINLSAEAQSKRRAAKISKDLPLLFIAGSEDPVGDAGVGVGRAAAMYRSAGLTDIEVILYEGYRHEILNEPCRKRVMQDIASWLSAHDL
ncbi:lysophospholipase [Collinsella sp. AGMB00827]|uniref:Lysophospholipase n=1 Tax=Collinsella ureilytica TaxID=2869515 RepID=A0ABS7MKM5_9ACTN|nr:lysophospholipase [Collinsella urealyticum]